MYSYIVWIKKEMSNKCRCKEICREKFKGKKMVRRIITFRWFLFLRFFPTNFLLIRMILSLNRRIWTILFVRRVYRMALLCIRMLPVPKKGGERTLYRNMSNNEFVFRNDMLFFLFIHKAMLYAECKMIDAYVGIEVKLTVL